MLVLNIIGGGVTITWSSALVTWLLCQTHLVERIRTLLLSNREHLCQEALLFVLFFLLFLLKLCLDLILNFILDFWLFASLGHLYFD